jgi:hypothetical protein
MRRLEATRAHWLAFWVLVALVLALIAQAALDSRLAAGAAFVLVCAIGLLRFAGMIPGMEEEGE